MTTITCSQCGKRDRVEATYVCFGEHGRDGAIIWMKEASSRGTPSAIRCRVCGTKEVPYIGYTCERCVLSRRQLVARLKKSGKPKKK